MQIVQKITPCLWFDNQAEEAANFYASVFKNSRIGRISRYGKEGYEIHGRPEGTVMTVEFEIEGPDIYRTQRRSCIHVQRGYFVSGAVRDAGRD